MGVAQLPQPEGLGRGRRHGARLRARARDAAISLDPRLVRARRAARAALAARESASLLARPDRAGADARRRQPGRLHRSERNAADARPVDGRAHQQLHVRRPAGIGRDARRRGDRRGARPGPFALGRERARGRGPALPRRREEAQSDPQDWSRDDLHVTEAVGTGRSGGSSAGSMRRPIMSPSPARPAASRRRRCTASPSAPRAATR